jgi:hypothetical protein
MFIARFVALKNRKKGDDKREKEAIAVVPAISKKPTEEDIRGALEKLVCITQVDKVEFTEKGAIIHLGQSAYLMGKNSRTNFENLLGVESIEWVDSSTLEVIF